MIKPILFNTDMVKAILDGRKTVTRRVVHNGKSYPQYHGRDKLKGVVDHLNNDYKNWYAGFYNDNDVFTDSDGMERIDAIYFKAPYKPGDILYVRETWCAYYMPDGSTIYQYMASDPNGNRRPTGPEYDDPWEIGKWRPSIHMPKEAARIWLKVKDVRVERLQEITEEQAKAEGISEEWAMSWWKPTYYDPDSGGYPKYRDTFAFDLWDSTIKKSDLDIYGWDANPWVWVIEFERCEKPEDWR